MSVIVCVFVILLTASLYILSILIWFNKQAKKYRQETDDDDVISSHLLLSSYLSIVGIFCYYLIPIIFFIVFFINDNILSSNNQLQTVDYALESISGNIAGLSFLYYQIAKLYFSFQSSYYQLSQRTLSILIFCYIITITMRISYHLVFIIIPNKDYTLTIQLSIYGISEGLIAIIPIIISIMFAKKLLAISLSLRRTVNYNVSSADINHDNGDKNDKFDSKTHKVSVYLTPSQEKIVYTAIKQTVLTFCESICFLLYLILSIWIEISTQNRGTIDILLSSKQQEHGFETIIRVLLEAINSMIWPTCIAFSFVFCNQQYNYCCSLFHIRCAKLFQHVAKEQIKKQQNQLTETLLSI